jgi:hypothetical protein
MIMMKKNTEKIMRIKLEIIFLESYKKLPDFFMTFFY